MDSLYSVYMHTSPSGKVYIGISKDPITRWHNGRGYPHNEYFTNAILKYGWQNFKHEILFTDLTKAAAEEKEMELIALYKSNNNEYGYNISNGGNCKGSCTPEIRQKISESRKGKRWDYFKGRKHTEESKKLQSENKKNYFKNAKHPRAKIVLQIDENGVVVQEYGSLRKACESIGVCPATLYEHILKNTLCKSYHWIYKGREEDE